jgi:hypothetical protein
MNQVGRLGLRMGGLGSSNLSEMEEVKIRLTFASGVPHCSHSRRSLPMPVLMQGSAGLAASGLAAFGLDGGTRTHHSASAAGVCCEQFLHSKRCAPLTHASYFLPENMQCGSRSRQIQCETPPVHLSHNLLFNPNPMSPLLFYHAPRPHPIIKVGVGRVRWVCC